MLTHALMLWRIFLAAVITALLIATLPQATEAATKRQRCIDAAEQALGHDIQASDYRIVLGTDAPEERLSTSSRRDLICGFGGRDIVKGILRAGDIFISGAGSSKVGRLAGGLYVGGDDNDSVTNMYGGRFYGHAGRDGILAMDGGVFYGGPGKDGVLVLRAGRFVGGLGRDNVQDLYDGIVLGQRGHDSVFYMYGGTFKGGPHPDAVRHDMVGGVFDGGGSAKDRVNNYVAGTLISVEFCQPVEDCP